jgi:hypothetical protein
VVERMVVRKSRGFGSEVRRCHLVDLRTLKRYTNPVTARMAIRLGMAESLVNLTTCWKTP